MKRLILIAVVAHLSATSAGCIVAPTVRMFAQRGERSKGLTLYVGGAGPVGNVGSFDVPAGLADGGYDGAVDVFPWQGISHAGDQINLSRNRSKAVELSNEIRRYRRAYPQQAINIIALSAGTGIATWALEYLPEDVHVDSVICLGCSLSSRYDLTRALRRVRGGFYVIYSEDDPILKNIVKYTGTVDRNSADEGVAGLRGFRLPNSPGPDTERQYSKLHNVPWRYDFADRGYEGGHIDSTKREFVAAFLAPVIRGDPAPLIGQDGKFEDRYLGSIPMPAHADQRSKPASRLPDG